MELILWRHAEAVDATDGQADLQRCLTGRGEKQARRIADWLRQRQPKQLRILSSPAARCRQTASALALPFDIDAKLGVTAEAADLIRAANWPDGGGKSGGAVLLIGHQPTLGRLAAWLLSGQEADWEIKKGALWWFSNRDRDGKARTLLRAVIGPDRL